jgi:hypothetical protein
MVRCLYGFLLTLFDGGQLINMHFVCARLRPIWKILDFVCAHRRLIGKILHFVYLRPSSSASKGPPRSTKRSRAGGTKLLEEPGSMDVTLVESKIFQRGNREGKALASKIISKIEEDY